MIKLTSVCHNQAGVVLPQIVFQKVVYFYYSLLCLCFKYIVAYMVCRNQRNVLIFDLDFSVNDFVVLIHMEISGNSNVD